MTAGDKLAAAALDWLGTPYRHNAKVKGRGVDCARLVIGAAEDAGLIAPGEVDPGDYAPDWHLHRVDEEMATLANAYCEEVDAADLRRGDILLYQYGRVCSHAAIYLGDGEVIHAYVGRGAIISGLNDTELHTRAGASRLRHVYRFKEDGECYE